MRGETHINDQQIAQSARQASTFSAIWRPSKVIEQSGLARSTLYLRVSEGLWTHPIKLGPRASGWPQREVEILNSARIAGVDEDEIRSLVQRLHRERAEVLAGAEA